MKWCIRWGMMLGLLVVSAGAVSAQECRLHQVYNYEHGVWYDFCYYPEWNSQCLYEIYGRYTLCYYGEGAAGDIEDTGGGFGFAGYHPGAGWTVTQGGQPVEPAEPSEPSGVPDGYEPGTDAYGP